MPPTPKNAQSRASDDTTYVQPRNGRTWFPILLGVLCGMIVLCVTARSEPSVFYRVTAWMFNESPPGKGIELRSIHFTLFMLTLAAVGGAIGALFSRWRKRTAFLFLLAILTAIAFIAVLGSYLDRLVWH